MSLIEAFNRLSTLIRNEEKARRAKSKRPAPFSIRLSQEERTRLYCGLTASPFWDDGRSPRAG